MFDAIDNAPATVDLGMAIVLVLFYFTGRLFRRNRREES